MHSFLDRVVSKVCRGCQWNSSVFDDRPRSWYRCRSCVLDGLLGSVHPIVFNGFNHFSRRQHHSSHRVRCSFKFLRKHVRLSSHVPWLVIAWTFILVFFFQFISPCYRVSSVGFLFIGVSKTKYYSLFKK